MNAAMLALSMACASPPPRPLDEAPPPRPLYQSGSVGRGWSGGVAPPAPLAARLPECPMPRVAGTTPPPPPLLTPPSGIRREVLIAWVRNLGDEDWATREAAEAGLVRAGWDGYRLCLAAANTSPDPEVRLRAGGVCSRYLRPVVSSDPAQPHPRIYNLACRYAPLPPAATDVDAPHAPPPANYGTEPCDQYARAMLCHYYYLRAMREEWVAARRGGDAPVGDHPVFRNSLFMEHEGTRVLVRDLLLRGVSREWIRWLLDDMCRRQNYWPPASKYPPWWLVYGMGFQYPH